MSNPSHMPWILREDYESFRRLCRNGDEFPNTFDEWFERATKLVGNEEARGKRVNKIEVDPQQFAAWCLASGIDCNDETLGAFAVKLAYERKN